MMKKTSEARKRSVLKGALAGLVGGIAGSAAKAVAEKVYPPRPPGEAPPPALLVEHAGGSTLSPRQKELATQSLHWTLGAVAGAVYGAAVEIEPTAGAWRGAAFGLVLNKMTHQSLLPKMGVAQTTVRQTTQERQSEWLTHAVFGVVTDLVRRRIRQGLL